MFPSGSPFNFVRGISQMTKLVARVLSSCLAYVGFEDFSSLQVFDTLRVILTFDAEYSKSC